MEAGRDLDKEVAERVMGLIPCGQWRQEYGGWGMAMLGAGDIWIKGQCGHSNCYPTEAPSKYSTNLIAAFDVAELMDARHGLRLSLDRWGGEPWWAEFADAGWEYGAQFTSTTAPHAICMAALNALDDMTKNRPPRAAQRAGG